MDSSNSNASSGALGVLTAFPIVLILLLLCLNGIVAAVIANGKGRSGLGYFLLGLLFLGPFAIAVAILVEPRTYPRPLAKGRRRFICARCGAENDVPAAESSYDCWRCSERHTIAAIDTPPGPTIAAKQPIDTSPGPAIPADSVQSLGDIWNDHLTGKSFSQTRDDLKQWWKDHNRR